MMNNNTMNNNNNKDDDNTMSYYDDYSSSSIPFAEAVLSAPAQQQHQLETSRALYKLAARNLRQYHGVSSMTAHKLEKTVALLGLRPRRIVAQGLAPRRLLNYGSSPRASAGESSDDESQDELREAESRALAKGSSADNLVTNNYKNSSSEEEEEEEEDSNSSHDDYGDNIDNNILDRGGGTKGDVVGLEIDVSGNENGDKKRPIHAALVAGGVDLRPRETKPLLRALGVSPRRLVRLGLIKSEEVRTEAGRRGSGPGQHLCAAGPGKGRHVGGRRGPPHGPPYAHGRRSPGGSPSRRMHGPPRRPIHGAGCHAMCQGGESEEDGMMAPLSPLGGAGHPGPRVHGGCLAGPPHGPGRHSMPTVRHGRGPPGGGKHGHGRGHGRCGGGFRSEVEGGEGDRVHGGGGGLEEHGPRRHGVSMGGPRGSPPRPAHADGRWSSVGGPPRPMHGPSRRPFHEASHHTMHSEEESEEEGVLAPLGRRGGPGHRGPHHHGGGGKGRSRGRPRGPAHGPVYGPFHGLFDEVDAPGAPPGLMHPRHRSPRRRGGGAKQRGGRNGGGARFYGGEMGFCGGGGGSGGAVGDMEQWWRAHLAHFHGGRHHQPQLEAF